MTAGRTPEHHPNDRSTDATWQSRLREWWGSGLGYRDVWMFAITGLVLLSLIIAVARIDQISEERVRECQQTNARNIETKKRLRAAAAADIAKAEEAALERQQNPELFRNEIEGRRDVTLALIDALAPVDNCDEIT